MDQHYSKFGANPSVIFNPNHDFHSPQVQVEHLAARLPSKCYLQPCFASPYAHLRAKACLLVGRHVLGHRFYVRGLGAEPPLWRAAAALHEPAAWACRWVQG